MKVASTLLLLSLYFPSTMPLPFCYSISTKMVFYSNYCIEKDIYEAKILSRIFGFAYE